MRKLILASQSARRKMLLEQAGWQFTIAPSTDYQERTTGMPTTLCLENACGKAMAVAKDGEADWLVLGADTIVVHDGELLGKPKDEADARRMLKSMSGRVHQVYTALCLRDCRDGASYSRLVRTDVLFVDLTDKEIDAYVATDEPYDKAGGYAIQGGAAGFVRSINGSYTNIVGLPLAELADLLKKYKDEIGHLWL